jgi:hypothetical protein
MSSRIFDRSDLAVHRDGLGLKGVQMVRKILLIVWLTSLAALLFAVGCILVYGFTVDRKSLVEDLGIIWGLTFGAWGVATWKARQ